MLDAGDDACAMEVSSHALAQNRTDGVRFAVAVFTNLTQDHLDFHSDMEDYFRAKRLLFVPEAGNQMTPAVAVVNVDDPYGARLAADLREVSEPPLRTFSPSGSSEADYRALDASFDASGSRFRCAWPGGEAEVRTPLAGHFNVENALAAIAACHALGVSVDAAAAALGDADRAPGRFEPVEDGQPFAVLVDYAHTPDSLDNVLARGAAADREDGSSASSDAAATAIATSARKMGEIAARLADRTVVTSDNPRSEDPEAIIADILAGIPGYASGNGHGREDIASGAGPARGHRARARRGGAGRHGSDRRQGPRAGPGVRGRPEDPLRRPHGGGRSSSARPRAGPDDRAVARSASPRAPVRRSPRRAEAGARSARSIDSREVGAGGSLLRATGRARRRRRVRRPERWTAGAWGVVVDPHVPASSLRRRARAARAGCWPPTTRWPRSSAWRRRGAASWAARWWGSPARLARRRSKDICRAMLPMRVHASRENFNTEIGLPLAILEAPPETEALVLEMAMRGRGQIAQLCEIAEPDVGAITNIGPVHLELLGTMEAIAEAKAEILMGLRDRGRAVIPADEEALEPHLHEQFVTITFGPGGDVFCVSQTGDGRSIDAVIGTPDGEERFEFPFGEAHNLQNALAAIAIGTALDVPPRRDVAADLGDNLLAPSGRADRARRGDPPRERLLQRQSRPRCALRWSTSHPSTRPDATWRSWGRCASSGQTPRATTARSAPTRAELGVEPILGVGELARDYAPDAWAPDAEAAIPLAEAMVEPGDAVLVKGSRAVGLELVTDELVARRGTGGG